MTVDMLVKIYLIGAAVFMFLFMYYPSVIYSKEQIATIKKELAKSILPPKLEALAITIALVMVTAIWPWWLTKHLLRKFGVIK